MIGSCKRTRKQRRNEVDTVKKVNHVTFDDDYNQQDESSVSTEGDELNALIEADNQETFCNHTV